MCIYHSYHWLAVTILQAARNWPLAQWSCRQFQFVFRFASGYSTTIGWVDNRLFLTVGLERSLDESLRWTPPPPTSCSNQCTRKSQLLKTTEIEHEYSYDKTFS